MTIKTYIKIILSKFWSKCFIELVEMLHTFGGFGPPLWPYIVKGFVEDIFVDVIKFYGCLKVNGQ